MIQFIDLLHIFRFVVNFSMEEIDGVSAKADVTYFISLALKKEISWEALALVLDGFKLTTGQYKNVVKILLKELQSLQAKLQSNINDFSEVDFQSVVHENNLKNTEIEADNPSENDNQSVVDSFEKDQPMEESNVHLEDLTNSEFKTIIAEESMDDEIEVLEVVKETFDEEVYLDCSKSYKNLVDENDEQESVNKETDKSWDEIDNKWYTFVKNDKPSETVAEESFQEKEFHSENETNENVSEIDKDATKNGTAKLAEKGPFYCTFCQKSFQSSSYLRSHVRIHTGDNPFDCKICNKRFKTNGELKKHENIHKEELPFDCMTCSKRFKHKHVLKRHERIHTGEVPYKCKTCTKRFQRKEHLQRHERIHSGEVPHECKTCKKRFKRKETMKIHERIHTGEVTFECKTCKKRFNQHSNLKMHERTHTGEKPFECKTCKKRFTQKENMKRHEILHTRR